MVSFAANPLGLLQSPVHHISGGCPKSRGQCGVLAGFEKDMGLHIRPSRCSQGFVLHEVPAGVPFTGCA